MKIFAVILLLLTLTQTNSAFTFYQTSLQNTTYYKCIKSTTSDKIIVPFIYLHNDVDDRFMENIQSALEAELAVEVVIVPTRCWTIEEEFTFLIEQFGGLKIQRFWVGLESLDEKCTWKNYTPEQNCQYLKAYLAKGASLGMKIEIVSLKLDWMFAFKNIMACPEISSSSLLWWWNEPRETEYHQIGGWTTPYMELVSTTQLCGHNTVANKLY